LICKISLHPVKSKHCIENKSSIMNAPAMIISDLT
jgi:hypothetical protein